MGWELVSPAGSCGEIDIQKTAVQMARMYFEYDVYFIRRLGRLKAGVLIGDQNISTAYEMIEEYCASILSNLSALQKQRECPPDSMEAVAGLMFAAARFADLPELRNLRTIFTERYGNKELPPASDCFVNKEFSEKISSKHPSTEMKLKMMREISKESSIKCDSKAFEERLADPKASPDDTGKKRLNGGSTEGDHVALKTDGNDALTHRRIPPTVELRVEPNIVRPEFHVDGIQKPQSHHKIEPSVTHSGRTGTTGYDAVDAKKSRDRPPQRSDRISEAPLNQSSDPKGDQNDTSKNAKHRDSGKSEVPIGHVGESEISGFDMRAERGYIKSKTPLDSVTREVSDGAANYRGMKNHLSDNDPTFSIPQESKQKVHYVGYEIDDQEEPSYKRMPSYGFERTTEKRDEEFQSKGNNNEISSRRRIRRTLGDDQDKPHHRSKTLPVYAGTRKMHEDTLQEDGDHDVLTVRSQSPLDDDLERVKTSHRSKTPRGHRVTKEVEEDTQYKGNSYGDFSDRRAQTSFCDGKSTKMPERAYYNGDCDGTFSLRSSSPPEDDREKAPHRKTKDAYGHNMRSRERNEDAFYTRSKPPYSKKQDKTQEDSLCEGIPFSHRSKPPYRKNQEKHEDAHYEGNHHKIHDDTIFAEENSSTHRSNPPSYSGKIERSQEDARCEGTTDQNSLPGKNRSPLGDESTGFPQRSKPPNGYNRSPATMRRDAHCRGDDEESYSRTSRHLVDKEDDELYLTNKPLGRHNRATTEVHETGEHQTNNGLQTSSRKCQLPIDGDQERPSYRRKSPPYGHGRTAEMAREYIQYGSEQNGFPLGYDQKSPPRGKFPLGGDRISARMREDVHYQMNDYESPRHGRPSPSNENQDKLTPRGKPPHGYPGLPVNMRGDVDYRNNDDVPSNRTRSPSMYAWAKGRNSEEVVYRKNNHDSSHGHESPVDYFQQFEEVDDRETAITSNGRKLSQNAERKESDQGMNPGRMNNLKPPPYIIAKDPKSTNDSLYRNGGTMFDDDADYLLIRHSQEKDTPEVVEPDFERIARPPYVISKNKSRDYAEVRSDSLNKQQLDEFVGAGSSDCRRQTTRGDRLPDLGKLGNQPGRFEQHSYVPAGHDSSLAYKPPKPKSVRQKQVRQTDVDTEFNVPPLNDKHDAYDLSMSPLEQLRNGGHEPGRSRDGSRERERESRAHRNGHFVDKQRPNAHRHGIDVNDEEVFMDELLLHYSKKESPQVVNMVEAGTKAAPGDDASGLHRLASLSVESGKRGGRHPPLETDRSRYRAALLPPEQTKPEQRFERHDGSIPLRPEVFDANGGRVHPKLPDYEDLGAGFAALNRRSYNA